MLLAIGNAGDGVDSKVDDKVVEELQENVNVNVIVILKDEVESGVGIFSVQEEVSVSDVVEDLNIEKEKEFSVINGFSGEISSQDLENLLNDDRVEKIEYDYPISLFLQDTVDLINASVVHALDYGLGNITGRDQTVCILDTGVNYTHPDLGGCYGNNSASSDCKVLGGYNYVNSSDDPMDDNGHGTHVAGIVAANSTPLGIAPDADLISIKVLNDQGSGFISDAVLGVEWCANNATAFNISVISMSLGTSDVYETNCDGSFTSLANAIDDAVGKNIVVLAAAGNAGNTTAISSPACITNATAVGWSDKSDNIHSSSNRNSLVKLFAPGSTINSTNINGVYEENSGTSMATPHVAGLIALLKQYYNDTSLSVNTSQIIQELEETGKTIFDDSATGLTFYRIDAYNALNDTANPKVEIGFSNDTVEMISDNLIININFTDAFLDSTSSNVSYPAGNLLADFSGSLELNQDNLTELGVYTINACANDTNGNENLTAKTFTVQDTTGPLLVSDFNSPADDPNYTATNYVEFNVSIISKYNFSLVSLYHNASDWHENSTLNLTDDLVNETSVIFNSTLEQGEYFWGIKVCDINDYCNYSTNRTLFVDQANPSVTLISPLNDTTIYTNSATFNFNVSDYGISSCDLLINDAVNTNDNSVSVNTQETFSSITLNNGNYTWDVGCTDNVARSANSSSTWKLIICKPSWSCGAWSDEDDACGTRTCTDSNSCGTDTDKPDTSKSCPSSGGGASGGTGGAAGGAATTTTTDKSVLKFQVNAGDKKSFGISKDVGINGLELDFKNAVANAEVTVEKVDGQPADVSAVENVYKYLKINVNFVDDDLKEAKIKFKVPKSWILINALNNPTSVFASRYTNGKWVKLETLTAGTEEEDQMYEAITPGFSYFAISTDKAAAVTILETKTVESNETEDEAETETAEEEKIEEKRNLFSIFTGSVIKAKSLISSGGKLYIISGIVIAVLVLAILAYKFRSKLEFVKKANVFSKINFRGFDKFKKIKGKIAEEKKSIKGKLKKRHKDRISREKEKLEKEKEELEKDRKEVEKLRKEEEKKKEKEEKEKIKREKELEKQKKIEEREREKAEKIKLRQEEEKVRDEERRVESEKREEGRKIKAIEEKEKEERFEIKHDNGNKWEDFELEDFDD